MKISGFTIVRNARKYNYPMLESIRSILPMCDEFVVNIGESEDDTQALIESLKSPKIKIVNTKWDFSKGNIELSQQTNIALAACTGDWAFYLQSDEVIHEDDLPKLRRIMELNVADTTVDALRFSWMHFYGSYYRYRIDRGWYQKQDRIIRNNGTVRSYGDAFGFERKDGKPLQRKHTDCLLYHYGWVQPQDVMASRRVNAEHMGITTLTAQERGQDYSYGDLERFPVYFGSHPDVMKTCIANHPLSTEDHERIHRKLWWHPFYLAKYRYKTFRRVKEELGK
jgi:glycosyltransferase involved in cell wall biosynthesis